MRQLGSRPVREGDVAGDWTLAKAIRPHEAANWTKAIAPALHMNDGRLLIVESVESA